MGIEHAKMMHSLTRDLDGEAAAKKLIDERRRADAEMAIEFANLQMPDDIRARARSWNMEAFFEVLWNNGFQAGFREGARDRASTTKNGGVQ